ncbi:hypothetical protein QYH69_35580 [Paraburkholderia sp. SARCC-3016]|uniref:hypothetical protein n=1 Tax=Paraburkholderia sp. SARCC-3016 TaxID=3058611 RepID=UPI0028096BEB|nr:hypothetical protein [Paraburkholderia sp. SARCC-3016]MDQ7982529.1 hypothetical protein [Paraburkholderia sp. SARCC-3016]
MSAAILNGALNVGPGLLDFTGGGTSPESMPLDGISVQELLGEIQQLLNLLPMSVNQTETGKAPPSPIGSTDAEISTPQSLPSTGSLEMPGATGASGPAINSPPSGGNSASDTNNDLENAMSQTEQKDPTLYDKTMKDGKDGDGNSLVEDELQAYKEGDISKQQAIEEVSGAQSLANQNGGGKINQKEKDKAQSALGEDVIKGGKSRAAQAIVNALESLNPFGALVKGIQSKTSKTQPENILQAGQGVTQRATQQAMQDMSEADPKLAQKFLQDAAGDGNAMVSDMVDLKNEENSGAVPNTFTDQDAQMLGSQVGDYGKGKVNSPEDQAFTQTFGTDTLYRGSTRGSKALDKVESTVGSVLQSVVAPVTDTVGGVDDLVHGKIGDAFKQFGDALGAAGMDAAMVVAPEAAPEIDIGAVAADGTDAAITARSALDPILSGTKAIGKANDYSNDVNNGLNFLDGNNNNGNDPLNG